jgi:Arabinose-binding domain of AraC transcription regulator, N-term
VACPIRVLRRCPRQVQLRESRQPSKLFGSRRASTDADEGSVIGMGERIYESTKLAAVFDVLIDQGFPASEILRNVDLQEKDVHSPGTRISLAKLMTACKNAVRLSSDRHLPYRIGASVHISTYGMYGFAILCCPDFRNAICIRSSSSKPRKEMPCSGDGNCPMRRRRDRARLRLAQPIRSADRPLSQGPLPDQAH